MLFLDQYTYHVNIIGLGCHSLLNGIQLSIIIIITIDHHHTCRLGRTFTIL